MNGNWNKVEDHIYQITGNKTKFINKSSVSGGCINQCWKIADSNQANWFIKTNSPSMLEMFTAEKEGLQEIERTHSIRSPNAICYGKTADFSYLVMEYIPLLSFTRQSCGGEQLAKMHYNESDQYGWKRDNTIGSTPQPNKQDKSWVRFWKNNRLKHQLDLAKDKGYPNKSYDEGLQLVDSLDKFFQGYKVKASLLHGDLWSGNIASDSFGNPVIYDPAVYYGDRETDLALTELFGGFNQDFYSAYNQHYALDQGYQTRKKLYNLYHILNHFNLLGGGYSHQALQMTQQLLSEIR